MSARLCCRGSSITALRTRAALGATGGIRRGGCTVAARGAATELQLLGHCTGLLGLQADPATGAPLHDEPLTLIREERGIRDPRRYFGVLAAIASGRTRNAEIASRLELPSSNIAAVLERLQSLGYVQERTPVTLGARRRRGFWQISDPFFRFWFRRVQPNRSRLDRDEGADAVWEQVHGDLDAYVGRIFEDICRRWLGRYSDVEQARSATTIGSRWSRDGRHEIDIGMPRSPHSSPTTRRWMPAGRTGRRSRWCSRISRRG